MSKKVGQIILTFQYAEVDKRFVGRVDFPQGAPVFEISLSAMMIFAEALTTEYGIDFGEVYRKMRSDKKIVRRGISDDDPLNDISLGGNFDY